MNRGNHLAFVVGDFKRYAAHEYLGLIKTGRCVDIGRHLWHPSFYDKLIPDITALLAIRRYIELNPTRWDGDRFGSVTAYSVGKAGLLNGDLVAFVASEGWAGEVPPQEWGRGTESPPDEEKRAESSSDGETRQWLVISTFTNPQEQAMLPNVWPLSGHLYK